MGQSYLPGWIIDAGTVLGIIAFIMALPTFLQMKYGLPKILVKFEDDILTQSRFLVCRVRNQPLTSGFLAKCGVTRSPVLDLTARLTISERGTGRILVNDHPIFIKTAGGVGSTRIELPASTMGVEFCVVGSMLAGDTPGQSTIILKNQFPVIPNGFYEARIRLSVDGKHQTYERGFEVKSEAPYTEWL